MHVKPVRYQNQRCLHFITFSCYHRTPLGAGPSFPNQDSSPGCPPLRLRSGQALPASFAGGWALAMTTTPIVLGGWPDFRMEFPIWGCPILPAFFAGGWALCADYNLRECMSNQSAIKTNAACISSRLVA